MGVRRPEQVSAACSVPLGVGYTNTGCDSLTPGSQGTENAWRIRTVVKESVVLQGTSESRQIIYRETIFILP